MISSAQRIAYEPLRSLGFASIGAGYTGVGGSFANPVRILKVNNATNANLIISFDGVNDMDFIFANSAYVFDYATNAIEPVGQLEQPLGRRFYVKEASGAPTSGSVYVTVIYASSH
jgi:hypothetical protein